METINRNCKDTLFRIIFGDHKENALALYNAVNGTNYTDSDDLVVRTIKNAVYMNIEDDVAFIFDDAMNLYEQQSTYNPNMPLRGLEYFSVLYSNHLGSQEAGRSVVYRTTLVKIPSPHYYVFYNGKKKQPAMTDLRLSDAYEGDGDLEIIARVINVNKGENKKIMERCKPLSDYSELVYRIRKNKEDGMSDEKAVKEAVNSCIEDNVLKDVLQEDENRAISSLLTALSQEEIDALHEYELRDARKAAIEEGLAEGREEGKKLAIFKLVSEKLITPEEGARQLGITVDQLFADMEKGV